MQEGPCGVGDGHFRRATPEGLEPKQTLCRNVIQQGYGALRHDTLFDDAARRENDGLVKELLGELPLTGGGPVADIGLSEQRGDSIQGSAMTYSLPARSRGTGTYRPGPTRVSQPCPVHWDSSRMALCAGRRRAPARPCRWTRFRAPPEGRRRGGKRAWLWFHSYILSYKNPIL